MSEFQEKMAARAAEIEEIIERYLPEEQGHQRTVLQAMNYSIQAGGKRLRPMFMREAYRLFGGTGREIEPFMAAIEMIHTYSLVHDDLPAMDNDDYRRGRKTTHVVYGEAMGILAGDGLLNYAFETAIKAFSVVSDDGMRRAVKALEVLARKAGVYGMIGGQTADIEAECADRLTEEQLLFIHEHKTAALIQASMMIGAILAGADEEAVRRIEQCAYDVGIAFQIQDDILDVTSTTEELGKPVGSDEKNQKQTYVTIKGLEASAAEVERLSKEAVTILESFPGDESFLKELVTSLIHRRK